MSAPRGRGTILSRVVATHLLVALPPALVLGVLVARINRDALTAEAQDVHLAVAARFGDALTASVRERTGVLAQAERILDMDDVPLERRKELLRALVAGTGLPHLALHTPDGKLDSLVRPTEGVAVAVPDLPDSARREAKERGWAVTEAAFATGVTGAAAGTVLVIVPWRREGAVFGWLSSELSLAPLAAEAAELRDQYLGAEGRLDVVDAARRYLASSEPGLSGGTAAAGTPFAGLAVGVERAGLATLATGLSAPYVDASGAARLGTVVSLPALRWFVATSRPESIALASLEVVRSRVILLSLAAALLAALVGLALARQLTDPIQQLTAGVRAVAASGFRAQLPEGRGSIELAQLRAAFNEVLRQLEEHRALARHTMQVRLRLSRFLSPAALHGVLTSEQAIASSGREEELTVLYAEVTAPAASASSVPREVLVALLGDHYVATCRVVEAHGGRIDHYSGDAVIGIFAHSSTAHAADAAVRAARAALAEVARAASRHAEAGLGSTIGIATGRGVIGRAPEEPSEISVVGELVDRAASLEHAAAPGTILVDEATRAALEPSLAAELMEAPGSALPERTYRADVRRGNGP